MLNLKAELTMAEVTKLIHKYLRHDKKFPHVWCPGCGNGIVLGALIRAIDRTGFEKGRDRPGLGHRLLRAA